MNRDEHVELLHAFDLIHRDAFHVHQRPPKRPDRYAFLVQLFNLPELAFDGDVGLRVEQRLDAGLGHHAREVAESITPGKYLAFSHGFSIHYKFIEPPQDANVFMVAPKGPGHLVRHEYKRGAGVPCLLAVSQDPTGDTTAIGLAYASAIGGGRAGIIETTFREETETDLFGEQAVLCGGLTSLIKAGFETLTDAGYSPEMAYFECLHEMKLIVDLLYEGGISEMRYSISNTAQYGDMTRGPVVVNDETKRRMRGLLADIQSGAFAQDWMKEARNGRQRFQQLDDEAREHPIERVGERLRTMMPWLAASRLVDKASN